MKTNVSKTIGYLMILLLWASPSGLSAQEYSLDDLYGTALQRAEKIRISEENILIAEAGKQKAKSYLLPRLSAYANVADYSEVKYTFPSILQTPAGSVTLPGTLIQPHASGGWGIRLDESLSLGGREITSLGISEENLERTRLDAYAVKEDYLFGVAMAYYHVLKAEKNLDIAKANVERLSAYRMAADKRLRIGEVTRTVLLRADAELSGAMSDHLAAKNNLDLAMAHLKRVVGLKDDVKLKVAPSAGHDVSSFKTYLHTALSERPDLKSLDVQKRMAAKQVRYARGAHWPNLSISGVYAGLDQSPAPSTINRESIYAGVALHVPIFEGGLRLAEVKEARSREKQSELLYEDLKNAITIEVQAAYLDLMTLGATLVYLENQLVFARDNYQAVARQFDFGLAHSIDLLDANTLLVSAERKRMDAVYSYELAVIRMKKVTGILLKGIHDRS